MTAVRTPSGERRSTTDALIRAAWLLAFLATALQVVGVLVAARDAATRMTAEPLTVSIRTPEPLHAVGRNSYGGSPYVADDARITATSVTAEVSDVATPTRVGLAFGPLAWAVTGAVVAGCLAVAFGRLRGPRIAPRRAAAALAIAGLATAVGTSTGQILDEIGRTGLQGVLWHGTTGIEPLGAGDGFTFGFGWLAVAVGAAAIAAVVARADGAPSAPTA